jgi:CDP-diacylglycerol--serine O-phosphatidyltransferase
MNWRQVIPTAVTILAMLSGFLSILVIVEGIRTGDTGHYLWAAKLIMLAMILDGMDGNLARWLKGGSEFGSELDTYVDMTAFGIAPAVLIFAVTLHGEPVWRVILPSAVMLSGCVRLARFKVKDPLRGQAGYAGLPITANGAWVATFVLISESPPRDSFNLNHGPIAALFLSGILLFIVLQVSNFRYPKPTKSMAMFMACVLLVAALLVPVQKLAVWAAMAIIALGLLYILFGPLYAKGMAAHKARKEARENGNGGI